MNANDVLGRRIAAALVDIFLLAFIFVVVGIASGGGHAGHGRATVTLSSGATAVLLVATLAYYFSSEAISGQTLGKRLLGIRVTTVDGRSPNPRQVLIRTLLRVVDSLPAFYLLGLLLVLMSRPERRQRIGDMAARTTVRAA